MLWHRRHTPSICYRYAAFKLPKRARNVITISIILSILLPSCDERVINLIRAPQLLWMISMNYPYALSAAIICDMLPTCANNRLFAAICYRCGINMLSNMLLRYYYCACLHRYYYTIPTAIENCSRATDMLSGCYQYTVAPPAIWYQYANNMQLSFHHLYRYMLTIPRMQLLRFVV